MIDQKAESNLEEETVADKQVEAASPDSEVDAPHRAPEAGVNGERTGGADDDSVELGAAQDASETAVETPAAEGSEPGEEAVEEASYDETFVTLEPGSIVKGKVVQIGEDEVMVHVGYKSEGRIPLRELGLKPGESPHDALETGQDIDVFVIKAEDAEGNPLLSKRRADARLNWERLERHQANGEIIEATVTERVKGGLLVDVGVRGFVPASHVDRNYVEDLDRFVGETIRLKVIEIDRQKNNVVLSRKEVLEQEYQEAKARAFQTLKEGVIVKGAVRRITNFGAFVDIGGGVEGLLHVSEMGWSRVRHPRDVVSEGDEIDVMILSVDPETERISLSLKETLPDPWADVDSRYRVGDTVEGEVTRVVDFGAFVKLEEGIEGLVHISQLADHHVEKPSDVVKSGQRVLAKVVSLDKAARRIGLSTRDVRSEEDEAPESQTFGASDREGGITLGDMVGDLGSLLSQQQEAQQAEGEEQAE